MSSPAERPVRFGVLGCADIALRRMLPALSASRCATVAAVASRDLVRAEEAVRRFGGVALGSYEALLRRSDVDAVYVPLPITLHAEWIERALLAGKHVLAEKPLSTGQDSAVRLFRLARQTGRQLAENAMFLHHSQHQAVRDLLAGGAIGDLRAVTGVFAVPPRPASDIRYRSELGGGALHDIGFYPLRAAQMLLGPGLRLAGAVLRQDVGRGVDLSGSVLLHTRDGVTATLRFGMENSYQAEYALIGEAGRIELTRAFTPPADHRPVVRVDGPDGIREVTLPADDQFANVVGAFVRAVRSGSDPAGQAAHAAEVIEHARLAEAVRREAVRIPVTAAVWA